MISKIAERTYEMRKVREKVNADEFQFCYSDTNEEEIKYLFGLLRFRTHTVIQNNQCPTAILKYLWKTNYEFLFRVLADPKDQYVSRIPNVSPHLLIILKKGEI